MSQLAIGVSPVSCWSAVWWIEIEKAAVTYLRK